MSIESGSAEPNVTFVGGKAIEQTEAMDSNLDTDTREDAMDAVRKAIQKAGEDSANDAKEGKGKDPFKPAGLKSSSEKDSQEAPERGPDGKFLPRDGKSKDSAKEPQRVAEEQEEAIDPNSASVKQLLRNREKLALQKKEAKDEISKERQAFQAERDAFARQQAMAAQQHAEVQRQLHNLKQLRSDPARVVREAGFDPEQFILDLAQEGTPEGLHKRQMAEMKAQLDEMKNWKAQQAKQAEEAQYRHHMQQAEQYRADAVSRFLKLGQDEEKFPHVANFYKGKERLLVAAGDLTSEEYRQLSGKDGSFEQILEYLEEELADTATGWYKKNGSKYSAKPGSKEDSQEGKGKAKPVGSGNAGKSLSPDASGERRALKQKALTDLDGEERHEAAKQAVRIALAASQTKED